MKYWIYDFNGTVLDDVDACIWAENNTIKKYLDRPPLTKDEYLDIFTFPVKKYYEVVGFKWDKVSYEEVGDYWFNFYDEAQKKSKIHEGVKESLIKNHENGDKNICLSASDLKVLTRQLKDLGVYDLFDEVLGLDNIYAHSKIPIALKFMEGKRKEDCMMIGDSLHDLEVAKAMGINCVLVAKGHQSKKKLLEGYDKVVDDIREVTWQE